MQIHIVLKNLLYILTISVLVFITDIVFATEIQNPESITLNINNFYALNPKNIKLLTVSGYQQTTNSTCGPAVVMSLMHYYNLLSKNQLTQATELKLAKEVKTNSHTGTKPKNMAIYLRHHNFNVKLGTNGTIDMLIKNIDHGIPTIVEWIDWGGHWVIITGYAINSNGKTQLILADPAVHYDNITSINGLNIFDADRFNSMWFDAQYFAPGHLVRGIYIVATPLHKSNMHCEQISNPTQI